MIRASDQVAEILVKQACEQSTQGNWIIYMPEINKMVRQHVTPSYLENVASYMRNMEQVESTLVTLDGIDVNLYTKYLANMQADVERIAGSGRFQQKPSKHGTAEQETRMCKEKIEQGCKGCYREQEAREDYPCCLCARYLEVDDHYKSEDNEGN